MKQADWQLSRNGLFWVLATFTAVVILHMAHLPGWITALGLVCVLWRILEYRGAVPFPGRVLKTVLVAGCVAGLSMSFRSLIALEPMLSMLVAGFGLKLLEMHRKRDAVVLIYVAFFTAAMNSIFTQEIPAFAGVLLSCMIAVAALVSINQPKARGLSFSPALTGSGMLATALPLTLVLFLVMPRLGAFWSIPVPKHQARTGVSSTMAPGEFSNLVGSDELAFRVRFDGEVPARSSLYWRGIVFSKFDGREWRQGDLYDAGQALSDPLDFDHVERLGDAVTYTVTMEPTYRRWLFALSTPGTAERGVRRLRDSRLIHTDRISHRRNFEMRSWLDYRLEPDGLHPNLEGVYRSLPPGFNPETVRLAQQWADEAPDPGALIQRVLAFYNRSFVYTLEPPLLGRDSVDEFMFETQRGFCEHFASSFVFFMRAAGHPARVIGGYLGGEVHPNEGFVTVRQYDAHAWAEVWIADVGWVRVDPTAAVAPERVEMSLADLFGAEDGFLSGSQFSPMRFRDLGIVNWFILQRDYLDYAWATWVLGYDQKQTDVLNGLLGKVDALRLVALFLAAAAVTALPYFLAQFLNRRKERPDPRDALILRFCRKLEKAGLPRRTGEGILDFAHRVAETRPELAGEVMAIADSYAAQRYDERPVTATQASAQRELESRIRKFSPAGN